MQNLREQAEKAVAGSEADFAEIVLVKQDLSSVVQAGISSENTGPVGRLTCTARASFRTGGDFASSVIPAPCGKLWTERRHRPYTAAPRRYPSPCWQGNAGTPSSTSPTE